MTAAFFLGVDGGGTKTRFALIDAERKLVGETTLGTTYHPEVGVEGVQRVLSAGIAELLADARVVAADVTYAFLGLPGYGEDSVITPQLDALAGPILGHDRYTCDNDMVCGWAGSLGAEDGINIVAGTGSIGYGQRRGRSARAGGWGEAFSDEGSAYWIAIQGLNAFSRMSDGRLEKGPLHALLKSALKLESDLDLCAHVYGPNGMSRAALAQLSPFIGDAASVGDEVALDIFRRAGEELARIADALRRKLGFEAGEPVRVSYSGGAFGAGDRLLGPFRQSLATFAPEFEPSPPLHEPHYGAALYAAKLAARFSR